MVYQRLKTDHNNRTGQTPPVAVIRRLRTLSGVTDHDDFVQEHEDEAPPSDEQATPLPEDTPPQPWSTAPAQEAEQRAGQHAQQWPGESLPEPEQSAGQHAPPTSQKPIATTDSMAASGAAADASDGI